MADQNEPFTLLALASAEAYTDAYGETGIVKHKEKEKTPPIAPATDGASSVRKQCLLFILEQVSNPSDVPNLNRIHNAPIKRKEKTPPRLNNRGDVFKQL